VSLLRAHTTFRSFVLLAILPCSVYGQVGSTKPALERADAYLAAEAPKNSFRGSVLVGINGKIEFEKGYGFADEEWSVRNTPNTKFRIASMTKQFTAACILLLQERGQLSVHDPVSKYLPGLPTTWQAITIHQLLTHTSGLPNYTSSPKIKELDRTGATPKEMIDLVVNHSLESKPGSKWAHSNTGYIPLGMIIENVSRQSYDGFLTGNIFGPLGMVNSAPRPL